MNQTIVKLSCPDCGIKLEDVGSYRLGCPNGCLEDMEQWQWQEIIKERSEA